ncbi:L,D-transpeptidase [Micromonospora sp. DT81.3]|uniref:L,D-transpeptidase n=1 Tax=Actinomycetes TaxID=1760 RepID=UPI003CE6ADAB
MPEAREQDAAAAPPRRRRAVVVALAVLVALATGIGTAYLLASRDAAPVVAVETTAPASTPPTDRTATPTPTPTPAPTGPPANTTVYDTVSLPPVDVFGIHAALPVDDDPFGAVTPWRARSAAAFAPVFADPLGQPVAALPREYVYGGTVVPVLERQEHWVKVLLVGRQAMPSQGNPRQLTGWLRAQDVELTPGDVAVDVSISARTIDIVRAGVAERVATDFGWGVEATPTPLGRAFLMTTRIEPEYAYTRGNPIIYLSVQSETLDGFGGAPVAITAFHYHDVRSGPVSNGCLRVGAEVTQALAALPDGTPVTLRP